MLTEIPEGYQIRESVNGVVSLTKMRRREICDSEIGAVMAVVRMHPKASRYRVDTKSSDITIYERIGPDRLELAAELGIETLSKDALRRIEESERRSRQFSPMMRFVLTGDVAAGFGHRKIVGGGNISRQRKGQHQGKHFVISRLEFRGKGETVGK